MRLAVFALTSVLAIGNAGAASFVEPQLHIAHGGHAAPQVALTLDACSGKTDHRILDVLVREKIPATIFVTGRWLRRNAETVAILKAHPDLFQLENHGANHVPTISDVPTMFGIKTARTDADITAEVEGGADALMTFADAKPVWYRDATARYGRHALDLIKGMGYRIAGYSLNADYGASLPANAVQKRIAGAKDGDVIIAHINQPSHAAGAGVARGIVDLKNKGYRFVRLNDVETDADKQPPAGI